MKKITLEAFSSGDNLRRQIGKVHIFHAQQIRRSRHLFLNTPCSRVDLGTIHISKKESGRQQTDKVHDK